MESCPDSFEDFESSGSYVEDVVTGIGSICDTCWTHADLGSFNGASLIDACCARAQSDDESPVAAALRSANALLAYSRPHRTRKTVVLDDGTTEEKDVPSCAQGVKRHPDRLPITEAMMKEFNSHITAGTWEYVPDTDVPPGRKIVGSTWAFDLKRDAQRQFVKWKARLCGQGFSQVAGFDYSQTYSNTVGLDVLRTFFSWAINHGYDVTEADYSTAYLNAHLEEEIWMRQPEGVDSSGKPFAKVDPLTGRPYVCLLKRAIYGLKNSGRAWEIAHWTVLVNKHDWHQCPVEKCLFRKFVKFEGRVVMLCMTTYVDNLFIAFPLGLDILKDREIHLLRHDFELNDLGRVSFSLGARLMWDMHRQTLTIDQTSYLHDVLETYRADIDSLRSKFSKHLTPGNKEEIDSLEPLPLDDPQVTIWQSKCQSLGGSLGWVAEFTRPDIRLTLSMCMKNVAGASKELYIALLGILAYLANTINKKLHYGNGCDRKLRRHIVEYSELAVDIFARFDLLSFCDSSYGYEKPMMCMIIFLGGSPVAWRMVRMPETPLSSTEAEWFGATLAATTMTFLCPLLEFLNVVVPYPAILFCDNKPCTLLSESDLGPRKFRHVAVRLAYLQEKCLARADNQMWIKLFHLVTDGMIADIGTKIQLTKLFFLFNSFMYTNESIIQPTTSQLSHASHVFHSH